MRTACVCVVISLSVACGDDTSGGGGGGTAGAPATGGGEVGGAPAGGAPAGGAGGDGPTTPCEVHCALLDTLEAEANCGYNGSGCVPNCETDAAADCGTELMALYACLDEQPGTDFVCVDGTFTLQGGACDTEAGVVTACFQQ